MNAVPATNPNNDNPTPHYVQLALTTNNEHKKKTAAEVSPASKTLTGPRPPRSARFARLRSTAVCIVAEKSRAKERKSRRAAAIASPLYRSVALPLTALPKRTQQCEPSCQSPRPYSSSHAAHADIFQWEYINPADPSQGKQQSTTLAPDGAGVDAVPGANLYGRNLTMAYLIGADLTNAMDLTQI